MRLLFLLISIIIAIAVVVTFSFGGRGGITPISATENTSQPAAVFLNGREKPEVTFAYKPPVLSSTLPVNQSKVTAQIYAGPALKNNEATFVLNAKSGASISSDEMELYNQAGDKKLAIASITKLATALTFLDLNPGWDVVREISADDMVSGGKINLFRGDKVKVRDLFYLSLVASDNSATKALVKSTGLGIEDFVVKMNAKASDLGLKNTKFADPIGLDNDNISTALEIARLAKAALEYEDISRATLARNYEFTTLRGKKRVISTTDSLLTTFPQNGIIILGGKTGYTESAGYCFVGKFVDYSGHEIISVVLGADTHSARFYETKRLVEWVYENYEWP